MHSRKRRRRGAQSPVLALVHTSARRTLGKERRRAYIGRNRRRGAGAPSPCSLFVLASAAGLAQARFAPLSLKIVVEDPHGQRQAFVIAAGGPAGKDGAGVEALFGGRAITIRGAREHNLKNVDLAIPRDKLVVFTGLSGSGKSSLAFDTIYAEGQRRYVESLSAYARQFLEMMQKPDVDQIDGLSPAIAIEQKTTSKNPRSTVGTVTEIHDYMRLLWARVGIPYSPATGLPIESQTVSQMVDRVLAPARAHAALSDRAGRARPKGRIPQGNRRLDEARFSAAQDRRRILRDRRRAGARQEAQARHRGGGRPHRRARPTWRRGSPKASRRRSSSPTGWRWSSSRDPPTSPRARGEVESAPHPNPLPAAGEGAHPLLLEIRLPGVRLHHRRDRAEAVLVQQSARRLSGLRRARLGAAGSIRRWSCPTRSSP